MNCVMANRDGSPDRVSEAFRRVSEDAAQSGLCATSPGGDRQVDSMGIALGVLVLAFIGLGILALF